MARPHSRASGVASWCYPLCAPVSNDAVEHAPMGEYTSAATWEYLLRRNKLGSTSLNWLGGSRVRGIAPTIREISKCDFIHLLRQPRFQ